MHLQKYLVANETKRKVESLDKSRRSDGIVEKRFHPKQVRRGDLRPPSHPIPKLVSESFTQVAILLRRKTDQEFLDGKIQLCQTCIRRSSFCSNSAYCAKPKKCSRCALAHENCSESEAHEGLSAAGFRKRFWLDASKFCLPTLSAADNMANESL